MSLGEIPARKVLAAFRGDRGAAVELVMEHGLPRLSGRVQEAWDEIEHRRENEWDAEAARREAMQGNVTPGQTIGALSDLHRSLIRVLAYTPAVLMADEEAMDVLNDQWEQSIYQLLITIHNPTIKYGIIGGFNEEIREHAEDYFERYSREIWGTVLALTSEDEITAGDFPPETGSVIETVGNRRQQSGGD